MTLQRLLELIYLMLPAYCANMAPPFTKFWRGWNRPIHRAWLGEHKTVVGFALGIFVALLIAFFQSRFHITALLWRAEDWFAVGLAQGAGAMTGDSVKSFFKRRAGIAPGGCWIPADQLDFIIGALSPLYFLVSLRPGDIVAILVFTFVADIAVNHVSFYAGIRNTKW